MRNRVLAILGFVLIVALVAALINGIVQDTLYPLVEQAYFFLRAVLLSLQSLIWLGLVFLGINLALRSLMAGRRRKRQVVEETRSYPGRISALATLVRRTQDDPFYAWRVSRHVADLARDALGHSRTLDRAELQDELDTTYRDLPPDVAAYLRQGLSLRGNEASDSRLERQWRRLTARFRPNRPTRISAESPLIHTIEYLEAELEVTHDTHLPSR